MTEARARSSSWEARFESIVDTSAQIFARNGYHATGINELCLANELGKGALYHYIGSKEELLAAIHDRVMDEVLSTSATIVESELPPMEQLTKLGATLIDIIARYPDHVWVFLHEFPALTGDRAEAFRGRRREYERRVESVIRAGIKTGAFRKVDPKLTSMAWLGMHNYTYLWLRPDGKLSAKAIAARFSEMVLGGIVA